MSCSVVFENLMILVLFVCRAQSLLMYCTVIRCTLCELLSI